MITPKEKAEELYFDFSENLWYSTEEDKHLNAKQCALIAVDEILNNAVNYNAYDGVSENDIWVDDNYWQEVKQEIEKL